MKNPSNQSSKFTKGLLLISLAVIIYGYFCRGIGLYFLWESKSIGWVLLFLGVINFLLERVRLKQRKKEKVTLERIGIGVVLFILSVQTVLLISFVNRLAQD